MTVQAFRPNSASRLRALFLPTTDHADEDEPSLRAQLFLIAHDDETGRLYLRKKLLEFGLAAAILLELWLSEYVAIGWRYDARYGPWLPDAGRITVLKDTPTGDPLIDSAVALLRRMSTPRIRDFIRAYTDLGGLYERVRGDMTAIGLLKVTTRRRFFSKTEVYEPVHSEYPVRARTKVRYLLTWPRRVDRNGRTDQQVPALTGLVIALGLTRRLHLPETVRATLREKLNEFMSALPDPAIRDVANAIAPRRRAFSEISH